LASKQPGRLRIWLSFTAILGLAFVVRLFQIDGQSAWHDEIYTVFACGRPLDEMLDILIRRDFNPPLHYLLTYGWFALFGYGVIQARLMSLVFGMLAVLFTGLAGFKLFGARTGLLAALMASVSTLGVMFSQEARGYAQLTFFSAASVYFFLRAAEKRSRRRWILFVACSIGAAYTHYFGVLIPAVIAIFALLNRRKYLIPISWWLLGLLTALTLYLPWLLSGVVERMAGNQWLTGAARDPSTYAKWFSIPSAVNWFNNGKWFGVNATTPLWLMALGAVLFTLPALYGSRSLFRPASSTEAAGPDRLSLFLVNSLWLFPLASIVAAGLLFGLQFNFRYVSFLAWPYYIAAAKWLADIEVRKYRLAWVLLILIHSGLGLRAVYFLPYKEDYRSAVAYVAGRRLAGDCAVFLPSRKWGTEGQFWYVYQRNAQPLRLLDAAAAESADAGCRRVWLVWDRTWWLNRDPAPSLAAIKELESSLDRIDKATFFGNEVHLFARR